MSFDSLDNEEEEGEEVNQLVVNRMRRVADPSVAPTTPVVAPIGLSQSRARILKTLKDLAFSFL